MLFYLKLCIRRWLPFQDDDTGDGTVKLHVYVLNLCGIELVITININIQTCKYIIQKFQIEKIILIIIYKLVFSENKVQPLHHL